MRVFREKRVHFVANAGLVAMVVAVVWCASCGSKGGGGIADNGDDGTGPGGSKEGGAACMTFGCATSSNGDDGGFTSGPGADGGAITVQPKNGDVTDTSCPGSLSTANVSALKLANANSASLKWLYPYDQTVFPGGLLSPVLQWSQTGTPDGVYLHLHSQKYDYTGCFKGSNPPQLQIPEVEWATAFAQSGGKSDPLSVQLSTITGSTVSGAIQETWTFAKGSLAGVVYYNTYGSNLVPGQKGQNGAVMKIAPGAAQPTAFLYTTGTSVFPFGPCVSCHALSSSGSMLVAQQHFYPGGLNGPGSMSFDLTKTPAPTPANYLANDPTDDWGLSAVYPDGSLILTNGQPTDSNAGAAGVFPKGVNDIPAMIGPKATAMYDTATGKTISFTGLTTQYAMMPMFSTDGTEIVYNDYPDGDAAVGGHTLTVMDFDLASKTFSNPRQIFTDPMNYPGWPFFTPDGKQVIFSLGVAPNFASEPSPPDYNAGSAQLYVVDLATKTSHRLDETSGYNGTTDYLPFPGRDENLDFFPTVNPISAGGYFWVYFTSRRQYGNVETAGKDEVASKSIWVSAIDIDPPAGTDPSHPAFYLPGQELGSGNIRAFAVLAPCVGNGATCESGLDCCGGTCTSGKCGVPAACAGDMDRCTATAPCCASTGDECIGGYCGLPAPK
jgi:WD40-like Beta Propeller Repeat